MKIYNMNTSHTYATMAAPLHPSPPLPYVVSLFQIECLGNCPTFACPADSTRPSSRPRLFQVRLLSSSTSIINGTTKGKDSGGGVEGKGSDAGVEGKNIKTINDNDPKTKLPFRFAQHLNGTVGKVFFVKGDDNEQILNFKRTIVGAFQVKDG